MLPQLSVLDNALLGAFRPSGRARGRVALGLPRGAARAGRLARRCVALLSTSSASPIAAIELAGDDCRTASSGLAEIARALVGRPALLLLDEPAAGLSLDELDRLGELIARSARWARPW